MTQFFLDIETIGSSEPAVIAEIAAGVCPPASITKAETLAAWEAEKKPALVEEAIKKTAFDGGLGHVIVFGYAVDDRPSESLAPSDESHLLAQIASLPLHSPTIIGHNVGWDLRFLWQRFVCLQVTVPNWLRTAVRAKPWDAAVDTMTLWNPDRDKKVGLDRLCRMLGIPSSKGELDGSKVWDYYKAGRIEEIADYCRADVEATRECYRRMCA